ncbi:uncharacterized protein KGF55_002623 [Candida pseudojiufengensis]|uniref:uncharacterized protein n=1 Tax=Candida pseudojiufengensis TaxID=497109 RepID=UPI0022245D2D|nr:uncharacterized protein KGF55_002623 [Candida pseudojiufengensis]KAI5963743.1 hypothetical protein KGF55_002623 [Candida pseudojiufengensis]
MSNDQQTSQQQQQQETSDQLISETKQQRNERFKNQLYQAGAKGLFRGTLIALITGYALSYKYNHGINSQYFRNVYKVWWFVGWNVVSISFTTDIAKIKISRQAALEDEIKRNKILENEYNKK